MLIRPIAAGLWFVGAEFYALPAPAGWSFADHYECPCQAWSSALPLGRKCDASSVLIPLRCGDTMEFLVYSEPEDRLTPARTIVQLTGYFKPGDVNFDGACDTLDWYVFRASLYDFNQDGGVDRQDMLDVVLWGRWCP